MSLSSFTFVSDLFVYLLFFSTLFPTFFDAHGPLAEVELMSVVVEDPLEIVLTAGCDRSAVL